MHHSWQCREQGKGDLLSSISRQPRVAREMGSSSQTHRPKDKAALGPWARCNSVFQAFWSWGFWEVWSKAQIENWDSPIDLSTHEEAKTKNYQNVPESCWVEEKGRGVEGTAGVWRSTASQISSKSSCLGPLLQPGEPSGCSKALVWNKGHIITEAQETFCCT